MRNEELGKEGVSMTTYKSAFALADCNSDSSIVGRWGSVAKIMAERFRTEVRIVPCYAGKSFFAQSEHAPDFIYSLNHEWKLPYGYGHSASLDHTAIDSLSDYAQFIEINWRMKHVERKYEREDELDRYECDSAECDPALNRPDYE